MTWRQLFARLAARCDTRAGRDAYRLALEMFAATLDRLDDPAPAEAI